MQCPHCDLPIVECNARMIGRNAAEQYLRDNGYTGKEARIRVADLVPEYPARELLRALDYEYGVTSHLIGNGCEHGFKPARNCPNTDCRDRKLQVLWDKVQGERQ